MNILKLRGPFENIKNFANPSFLVFWDEPQTFMSSNIPKTFHIMKCYLLSFEYRFYGWFLDFLLRNFLWTISQLLRYFTLKFWKIKWQSLKMIHHSGLRPGAWEYTESVPDLLCQQKSAEVTSQRWKRRICWLGPGLNKIYRETKF